MKFSLFIAAAVLACPHADLVKRAPEELGGSAVSQVEKVWQNIVSAPRTQNPYLNPVKLIWKLNTLNMHQTVEVDSEELPKGHGPIKLVHSAGVVGKAVFESTNDHPYTGVFTGSENMIIRLSLATPPEKDSNEIVPGVAFKFFRDEMPTTNFMAMFSTTAQKSYNFFHNDISNHIQSSNLTAGAALVDKKFGAVTTWTAKLGLLDASKYTSKGKPVENAVFPFQLVLRPKVRTRENNEGKNDIFDQLSAIPAGTQLYEVYATDAPKKPFKKIGAIKTTTNLVKSITGDQLFFRHRTFEDDFRLKQREWYAGCPTQDECEPCNLLGKCDFA